MAKMEMDPELLTMGRVERLLRKVPDGAARNRIANWVATRDWSDKPIPYTLSTPAGKADLKAAE